ncbi:MAG: tRNA uridine-5-carboxymethylaminomethyl(34) synthesis GTPase MnmE [Rhodothermales bacterium]
MMSTETIAAIATARGEAALAIVRLSGPEAVQIATSCFRGADLGNAASHTAHVGYIIDAEGHEVDQVVVVLFKAPRSVTGENVVEISCHGGDFASQFILKTLVDHGARLANPGEFTQRAFLNGKMDLTQAEAVADLIHASSSMAHRVSLNHIQGRYSEKLSALRAELLELCAFIELELDFSEEDVDFADKGRLVTLLDQISRLLNELLSSYQLGVLVRDGVRVVIGGRPNAGKSTLLNALAGRDRAIVSDIPGTTRDEIEAEVEIKGLRFRFVDTAGLREARDVIEAEGVRRAKESIESADLLLYVFDVTLGLDEEEKAWLRDIKERHDHLPVVLIANKSDQLAADHADTKKTGTKKTGTKEAETKEASVKKSSIQENQDAMLLSAESGRQDAAVLEQLIEKMLVIVAKDLNQMEGSPVVMNQRHQSHLGNAFQAVTSAQQAMAMDATGDTLALDLRIALHELGHITGEITNEDVLDQIFSRFCIGK